MQTLLIENGATSGFLVAFYHFFEELPPSAASKGTSSVALSRKADLAPGLTSSVRLDSPVYSDRSRTGDPISATVTYPLCKNGEQVACKSGELLVPPGTKVNGTILFAKKAPDKYSRPLLALDFSNIVHDNGRRSPLYARVIDVDNARESISNNEILGIVQPHASTKASIAMAALGAANPIAGYTVKGVQAVYGLSIRRETFSPTGTDMQIQIVRPSMLKQKESWAGWKQLPVDDQLRQIATTAPLRTATSANAPSDPTNLLFLGGRKQLLAAFGEAGWFEADDINVKSALKAAQATVRQTGYSSAPVSLLLSDNRPPDLVFQKSLDTFAKRHHVRVWKLTKTYDGQEVWVAAATVDLATTNSKAGTKWAHASTRTWTASAIGWRPICCLPELAQRTPRWNVPSPRRKLSNATGDTIVTDGKISVVQLAIPREPATAEAATPTAPQP